MSRLQSWLPKSWFKATRRTSSLREHSRPFLAINRLEDRVTPTTFTAWGPARFVDSAAATQAFSDLTMIPPTVLAQTPDLKLSDLRAVSIDLNVLKSLLKDAPLATPGFALEDAVTVTLPTPDGKSARFKVWEASVTEAGYVTLNPDMKMYRGRGIDDPYATLAADLGSWRGFHASVRSPNGSWSIDPYFDQSQSVYAVYDRADAINDHSGGCVCGDCLAADTGITFQSSDKPSGSNPAGVGMKSPPPSDGNTGNLFNNGTQIRQLRLALAATSEYTAIHGGTVAKAEADMKVTLERINQIYLSELSVEFVLVTNNINLIYDEPVVTDDPYTSGNKGMMLDENQANVRAVIGKTNYDIGHVFDGSNVGGQANPIGNVGNDSANANGDPIKGRGVSTSTAASPTDAFTVQLVCHEMGHQMGAHHTFNGADAVLTANWEGGTAAFEPGEGSTFMSYGNGAAADPANSIPGPIDDYFHIASLNEITDRLAAIPTVGTKVASGNSQPVADAGLDYTIPTNTPFMLTGSGSDPNVNFLSYTWEQYDKGLAPTLMGTDPGNGPLFRSIPPSTTGNVRSFPDLATVLAGKTSGNAETAPTTVRDMEFRLTVRDHYTGTTSGAFHSDTMTVHTKDTGSGFAITNFNTTTRVYPQTTQTVTWNVAGTTGNGINTSSVWIDLSKDGGATFTPISYTENDGSATVSFTTSDVTNKARLRVRASGNIFYDINDADFQIRPIPTTIVVDNIADAEGYLDSLRDAITQSNNAPGVQTIVFDTSVFSSPQTITVSHGEMAITEAVTINGPGASFLTLSGNDTNRIFNTDGAPAGASVKLSGLTLTAGKGIDGGAINVGDESVTITDCLISNNSATEDGGAINVQLNGSLFLSRSTVSGNTASDDGGGIYCNLGGSAYLVESALVNNRALNGTGGGLSFWGTATGLTTISSTIAGNSANTGGGGIALKNFSGTLNVVNSTVTANYTFSGGGGGIARLSGGGSIALSGSIVSGNTGPATAPDILSGTVSAQYCAIGSTAGFTLSGSNNLIGQNLKLRTLASNGGPTPTIAFDYDSPLRGKGVGGLFTTDQRGFPRDSNGVDIGAFELQTTVTNTSNSGLGSLRDAVAESNRVAGTDTITFGSAFNTPQTITLLTGDITLMDAVTIQGNGESLTRISGNTISRIFNTNSIAAGKTVTLRGLTLTAGKTEGSGGAVLVDDEYLVVEDCVISNSFAGFYGGGIAVGASTGKLSLLRSTLSGNSTGPGGSGGGIRFLSGGNSEIVASTLVGNVAQSGGGLYLSGQGSSVTVLNSTLSGNSAGFGGGIAVDAFIGAFTIRNSTIVDNTAYSRGGGMEVIDGTPNINIESTIVAGNNAGITNGPDIYSNSVLTINRSAIGTDGGGNLTFTGADNLPYGTNLKLGALANYGGSTLSYLPANDSPLINAGSNPSKLSTDQRGVSRTLFGATDIGSVETTIAPPDTTAPTIASITSTTANGTYGIGTPIGLNVIFSESVTLTGTLMLTLDTGAVVSISGPQTGESFGGSYTIAAGQNSPDLNVTAIALTAGSTLVDGNSNKAVLTLPVNNLAVNKDIVVSTPPIDNNAPTITGITSPTPNGTYAAGATIGVTLTFSEPVTLSGGLFVFFDSGGSMAIQGPQTASMLSGTYTVAANQNSPDLNVTAVSLDANSSLLDAAGNKAVFTLPASNNLASNSNLVVGNVSTQTYTVTTTNDFGAGSLRQAITDANNTPGLQTIVFDSTFNTSKTITLTGGTLLISDAVIITGKGATLTTIHGNGNRLFRLDPAAANVAINFSGLTLTGGNAGNGGAIFVENEVLTLTDVRVTGNTANSGAGIHVSNGGKVNLINSTISGNTASNAGGALNIYNGGFSIQNSSIINNAAAFSNKYSIGGAGINFFGTANATLQVINSTISGNSTSSAGGGIRLRDFNGTFTINNSTLTNNSSYLGGGGINRSGTGSGTIGLQSSIISGNSGGTNIVASGTINASYSAVGPSTGFYLFGAGNLPSNTNLKLATLSAVPGSIQFVHLPASDSPVLNAGSNTLNLITDQRGPGFPRVLNGAADIGAVEVAIAPPSTVVTNINDSGAGSLRQAILNANSNVGADTVSFDPAFFSTPRTITLGGTQFVLSDTTGPTTISGPGASLLTINGNNASRVFQVNSSVTASIAGMTITGGNSINGGALQNSGTVAMSNSRFINNKSDNGGAIYNVGMVSVSNSSFDNNAANSGNGWGGAIINGTTVGAATITACTFTNNFASQLGGAVIGYSFNITDSIFVNNTAGLNGGALRTDGTVVITGSTFSGNSAANDGGAIMSHGGTTITNSTLANNIASIGGGVYFFQGTGSIRNVTVAYNTSKNTAVNIGGGIQIGTAATVSAVNSIVAGNIAASGLNVGGTFAAGSTNNVLDVSAADAGLGTLASNGGTTQTIALLPNSPAINAGTAVGAPTADQRGLPRAGGTDIGAFELQATNNVLGLVVNDGAAQRSRLTKVQVYFANPVDAATLGAITLTRTSGGTIGTVVNAGGGLIINPASGMLNSITLTFQNIDTAGLDFGSLADGRWQLSLPGLDYQSSLNDTSLRRIFGDGNNDGTMNASDFADFGNVFGGTLSNNYFDFDNNGTINAADFAEFGNRFGITL